MAAVSDTALLALPGWTRTLWARLGRVDPRYPVSFLITLILVLGEARYGVLGGYDRLIAALGVCTATELILSRVRMLHVTLTYVACFVALAAVRSLIVGGPLLAEIAPLTGPMYQLFIFFMITDPKTTVSTVRGRMIVAATVAAAETAIRLAGDHHVAALSALYPAPPILALAIVGPLAKAMDLYCEWRSGRTN